LFHAETRILRRSGQGATLEELLRRIWEHLIGRVNGPFAFRFVIQPAVAALLAVRAGLKDARAGRPPYAWALLTDSAHRKELLLEGWKDLANVFGTAIVIDLVYQIIRHRWIYPGETLIVATVLAFLPYPWIRGLVNRIARRWQWRPKKPRGGAPVESDAMSAPARKDRPA
jgi:hypothetical protein